MNVLLALAFTVGVVAAQSTYTTKYDNIDLDEILSNERLYKNYFDCLANNGKCTPDGKELKGIILIRVLYSSARWVFHYPTY